MCLATVYNNTRTPENLLCKNIMDIRFQDGKLVFTDIFGVRNVVDATLEKINLSDNYVLVKKNES